MQPLEDPNEDLLYKSIAKNEKPDFLEKFIAKNKRKAKVHYPRFLSLTTLRRFINTNIREIEVNDAVFMQFVTDYHNNKRLIKVSDNYDMPKRVMVKFNPAFTITCPALPQQRGRPRALSGEQIKKLVRLRRRGETVRSIAELIDAKKSTVLDYLHKLKKEGCISF